jgi:hypothetical protein
MITTHDTLTGTMKSVTERIQSVTERVAKCSARRLIHCEMSSNSASMVIGTEKSTSHPSPESNLQVSRIHRQDLLPLQHFRLLFLQTLAHEMLG